jgi:glycosyltransferase involved in cell wall biosynthesis
MKAENRKPFFSVIIPTLNEEVFLPIILTSFSKQTIKDFEVIVVDGNSSDKTIKIANSFHKKLPKLTILKSLKKNVSIQRNLGGKRAHGKYLLFFDADSDIENSFLSELYHALNKNPVDFFSTKVKYTSSLINNILLFFGNTIRKHSEIMKKPMYGGCFLGCEKQVFLKNKGFDPKLKMGEDHDFTWRCAKKGARYKLFKKPQYSFSFRRFEQEGYLKVVTKWGISLFHSLTRNKSQVKFAYQMGGKNYQKNSKKT